MKVRFEVEGKKVYQILEFAHEPKIRKSRVRTCNNEAEAQAVAQYYFRKYVR